MKAREETWASGFPAGSLFARPFSLLRRFARLG
jgi:hypothetical protein